MRLTQLLIIALIGSLTLISCKKTQQAERIPPSVSSYVYAFTSGLISKASPIRVRFASPVITEEQVGENSAQKILSFKPAIPGQAVWEDVQTLRFTPADELTSGTSYIAEVNLQKVFDQLPPEAKKFEFDFRTRDQSFDVQIEGLQAADLKDLSKQRLNGYVYTADVADAEQVEKLLDASQDGQKLDVVWQHEGDRQQHTFQVNNIKRTKEDGSVKLNWNGKSLGVNAKDSRTIEVPSLENFKITQAQIAQGKEQYIVLHFSDPLLEEQNVEGLLSIIDYDGKLRFLIEGNKMRIYPADRLQGERRIRVNPGIRNINNFRMQSPGDWTLSFEDIEPQVRLLGSGVILPNSEGLILPFEAVSLRAIEVEVFKIYHNNILQFLQFNDLNGSYRLREVGRVMLRTEVNLNDLNPDGLSSQWTRYALDLGQLVETDAEAIYQIRIGFRPRHSTYYCGDGAAEIEKELTVAESFVNEEGEIKSMMDDWYGIEGWYPDFEWDHREDPCFAGYYNSDRFVQRNILASNLGVIAKGGKDNSYLVSVSDLRTTNPIGGATLEFYDYQQQLLGSAQTDGEGLARISLKSKAHFLTARQDGQKSYLQLDDGNSLSLSRFDIAGVSPQKGMKGMLYAERGVWRPGDSVFLNFILEDKQNALPANYPVAFELIDALGRQQEKRVVSENINKVYALHFRTGSDAPTGNWIARVKAGGATFDRILKIETVKPNRLKIDLDFGREKLSATDEPLQAQLKVDWLHGAPASNLKAMVEAELRASNTTFSSHGDFVFDDPARDFSSEPKTIFEGELDARGTASFNVQLLNNKSIPGRLQASFKTRAFEKTGEFSSDSYSIPYDPFATYAGLNIPVNKYGVKRLDIGKSADLDFILVDTDGNPLANKRLEVGLYRVEWSWWWERDHTRLSNYNSANHYNAQNKTSLNTNQSGAAKWNLSVDDWGRYLVRVCDPESGHCAGDFFYAGSPWYGDEDGGRRQAAAMLAFSSDKKKYNVGETATLNIPTGEAGRALVSIENGTRVLETYWINAQAGDNEFKFPLTEEMAPTVYAHVSLLQPHADRKNDLPIRMYGTIPISVEDPQTHLAPKLKMPEELKPEESFILEVSEANKKEMTYTIALVDEGLLGLTRFKTPDPWNHFYAREALGVKTWDLYDDVLGAYGGTMERILSIGGDGEIERQNENDQANRFKPVVRHLGPFKLKKGEKAKHQIDMPNYVGAVRTMVVAAQDGAYGSVDKTVPVRQPLMVLATLPRVLGPGERFALPVNVFAMTPAVKNADIRIEESSGLAQFIGARSKNVRFAQPGDELVTFDVQIAENVGVAKFVVAASSGGETARQEIELQVRNPNPYQSQVYSQVMQEGENWTVDYTGLGMAGTNEAILEVSALPAFNLEKHMKYLIRYPYGCIEQTLSGGFPQLHLANLIELDEKQKAEIPQNIQATIDRLKQFQTATGGFAYWPGQGSPDHWGTNYGGHFLLEAKELGYSVSANLLDSWLKFQQKTARMWDASLKDYGFMSAQSYQLTQAYRLYTLALAQKPELGAMNRLRETKDLSLTASWRLAGAYALAGKAEIAETIIQNLDAEVEEYTEMSYTYGSRLRDRSMILETLDVLGRENEANQLLVNIAEELGNQRWFSTQTTAYALLAIGKYLGDQKIGDEFTFSYQLDGGRSVNAGSSNPVMQIALPVDRSTKKLILNNQGKGILYGRLLLRGQPLAGEEVTAANNLQIAVTYRDLEGKVIDETQLPQGADFVADVRITHPGQRGIPYQEMALNQIFPSGWEIINARLDDVQRVKEVSPFEHRDFRDDRVYTFFDIPTGKTYRYQVRLNAAYQGRYYLPAVSCEAMYDHSIYAREAGRWVEVLGRGAL